MSEKGLLTKQLEDLAVKGLDYVVKTKGVVEVATDAAIKLFVPIVDNNVIDGLLPDEVKEPIRDAGQLLYDAESTEDSEQKSALEKAASEKLSEGLSAITKGEESDTLKAAYAAQFKALILWAKVGLELMHKQEASE